MKKWEYTKVRYAREICRGHGIRYMIKGVNDALFIYCPYTGHYMQVCYSLLNHDLEYIKSMIEKHIENFC